MLLHLYCSLDWREPFLYTLLHTICSIFFILREHITTMLGTDIQEFHRWLLLYFKRLRQRWKRVSGSRVTGSGRVGSRVKNPDPVPSFGSATAEKVQCILLYMQHCSGTDWFISPTVHSTVYCQAAPTICIVLYCGLLHCIVRREWRTTEYVTT